MSDMFQYRAEIDLQRIVDEQARKLQRLVDEATLDKAADTLANFGYVKADGKSRWHELFGTPERAAEYFAMQCFDSDGSLCYYCPFDDCDRSLRNMGTHSSVHDKMLEWLRGDAE